MKKLRRDRSGQSVVLMVLAVTLVATTTALYTLERSQRSLSTAIEFRRTTNITYVMNSVARWLQYTYQYESGCDPYVLNNKINLLPNRTYTAQLKQNSLDTTVALAPYQVSIGEIRTKARNPALIQSIPRPLGVGPGPTPPDVYATVPPVGVIGPQDVSVTYWLNPFGQAIGNSPVRYEQTITLINTCSTLITLAQANPVYGALNNALVNRAGINLVIPGNAAKPITCPLPFPVRTRGAIDATATTVNTTDRSIFQNWLKHGDITGVTSLGCMDLNNDGLANETDLNILDKSLKGYLYFIIPSVEQ